jgi:GntR family transcriptional regulator
MTPQDPELSRDTLYRQLAARLRTEIQDGTLAPGTQVPTENALMDRFKVSRQTARSAIAALRAEGMIHSIHGKGSFVREEPPTARILYRNNADPWADLLPIDEPDRHRGYADQATADLLGIDRYEQLFLQTVKAISRTTGQPVITKRTIPGRTLEDLPSPVDPFADRSTLIAALTAHHGPLSATEYVGLLIPPGDQWPDLHITTPTPALETIRITHTHDGRPLLAENELTVAPAIRLAYPLQATPNGTDA